MSREAKLACGVLLLILSGLLAFLARDAQNATINPLVISGVFGIPGLLLLSAGILPLREKRQEMHFAPSRLFGGIFISVAGCLILYLFYNVLHVMPIVVLIGALISVPVGVLFAASCWTERSEGDPSN